MAVTKFLSSRQYHLSELAAINLGYSFRDRLERAPSDGALVVQMRDLSVSQEVRLDDLYRIRNEQFTEFHYLQPNDLVFRSRGVNNTAAIVPALVERPVLAAPLMRIRPRAELVLPRYLQWYINGPLAQSFFASHARGTSVNMISKECLAALTVLIPPVEVQALIVDFAALAAQEEAIQARLTSLKREYYQRAITQNVLGAKRSSI